MKQSNTPTHVCRMCGDVVPAPRYALGYKFCLDCGEDIARAESRAHCIVPMHKSNYVLCTTRETLRNLNPKHPH